MRLFHRIDNDNDNVQFEQKIINPDIMSNVSNHVITDDEALSMTRHMTEAMMVLMSDL